MAKTDFRNVEDYLATRSDEERAVLLRGVQEGARCVCRFEIGGPVSEESPGPYELTSTMAKVKARVNHEQATKKKI